MKSCADHDARGDTGTGGRRSAPVSTRRTLLESNAVKVMLALLVNRCEWQCWWRLRRQRLRRQRLRRRRPPELTYASSADERRARGELGMQKQALEVRATRGGRYSRHD